MANTSGTTSNTTPSVTGTVIQLHTIDDSRKQEPVSIGEIASVLEYSRGSMMGGGVFVYDATNNSTPDDGGLNEFRDVGQKALEKSGPRLQRGNGGGFWRDSRWHHRLY